MLDVVCVLRSGGKIGYNAEWVRKLQDAVARNLSCDYRFTCLSDCEVACERIVLEDGDYGFWSKLQLFKPGLFTGSTLYLDLDTVICQSLDPVIEKIKDQQFVMWYEADKNIHSSAFMYWQGDHSYLWHLFKSHPLHHWKQLYGAPPLYGDQALISEHTHHSLLTDFCPTNWFHIANAKDDCNLDSHQIKLLMFRKTSQKPSTMPWHALVKAHWI